MKKVLVGNGISEKCEEGLIREGYKIVKLPDFSVFQKGVAYHADMLVFFDGEELVTHPKYYKENKGLFDGLGVRIALIDESASSDYPSDVLLNCVLTDAGLLFSKSDSTARYIKNKAKKIINVKQGYTACSTCRVSENAFITSDDGLYTAYTKNGIDCLKISKGGIDLPYYNEGFIGGASVVTKNAVMFFGKIEDHVDYRSIYDFAVSKGKQVISLSDERLTDIGGGCVIER